MQSSGKGAVESADSAGLLARLVVVYSKGLAMGTADAIPGVSGGTIALVTGIYERLIRALTALDPSVLRRVPSLYSAESRRALWGELAEMDVPFLVALGAGMVTAVVVLARVVQVALSAAPGPTFAFFCGLIGASAVVLFERGWFGRPGPILAAAAGFVVAFVVAGQTATGGLSHGLPVVFGAGLFAISGMVLPGVSGAFILLLLGQYDYMTATLNEFVDGILAVPRGGFGAPLLEAGTVVAVFIAGAVVGLFTVAYLVRTALRRHRSATFAFLVSLMVGALRYPVVQIAEETARPTPTAVASLAVALVAGLGAVLVLDHYTDDLRY